MRSHVYGTSRRLSIADIAAGSGNVGLLITKYNNEKYDTLIARKEERERERERESGGLRDKYHLSSHILFQHY
jgi:hypothetical protein